MTHLSWKNAMYPFGSLKIFFGIVLLTLLAGCGGGGSSDVPPLDLGGGSTGYSATVSWNIPTQNVDASAADDLAGYKIYYGTDTDLNDTVIDLLITEATCTTAACSYQITGLPAGNYHFVVTAYNTSNNESAYSDIINGTLP